MCILGTIAVISPAKAADYVPWEELSQDCWIQFLGGYDPNMYPVNAADDADIEAAYPISFVQAASGNKARGMNALKFIHGGLMEGHLVSKDKAGSFKIINTGDSNIFTDVLLLIAVDANNLDPDFAMTINLQGQTPYLLDVNDFVYYDDPFGGPAGSIQ